MYTLCLKTYSLIDTQSIQDYFKLPNQFKGKKIKSILQHKNDLFLFFNKDTIKIDNSGNIEQIEKTEYFGNLPKK